MPPGRLVYRNPTYVVFGLGIDAIVVLVAVVDRAPWLAVVLAPLLALGVRWATMRVVIDGNGVRVVNFWRTHRVAWRAIEGFVLYQRNVARFGRRGKVRAFLGLVAVRRRDGREIAVSATSAAGTMTPSDQVLRAWAPALAERFNAQRPAG